MKKLLQLTKALFVAVALLGGTSNAWAEDVYTNVYTRATIDAWTDDDVTDWNGSSSYLSRSADYGLGATSNLTASSTKTFTGFKTNSKIKYVIEWYYGGAPGRDNNYDYIQIGDKIRLGMNNSYYARLSTDAGSSYASTNYGSYGKDGTTATITIIFDTSKNTVESFTFGSTDLTSLVSSLTLSTFNTVTLGFIRGGSTTYAQINYIKTITVSECEQKVTNVGYTVNYKLAEETVKTVSSTSIVGATITADAAIDGEGTYAGNHYLITAAEAPSMTLVADAASNVLNVSVRAPYTATLNVTRTIGGVAQTPVVKNLTETDAKVCSWNYTYPMYVQKDGVYYVADETATFGESGVFTNGQTINKTVAYTYPDYSVVYFAEPNETTGTNTAYSNGSTGYIKGGVVYSSDQVIRLGQLPAGSYRLITNVTGDANRNVVVGDYTAGTESFPTALVTITTTGEKDESFTVDGTQLICVSGKDQGSGKFNQSATVDYILVKASTQKATIGTTGWTTFASAYPLNLSSITASEGTATAYYASTASGSTVTMTSTASTGVAAGEGLALKGTAGATVTIPVAASGTAISGNKLVGCTTSTALGTNANYYVLVNNSGTAEFQKLDEHGATIPAGKAYLNLTGVELAPSLSIVFEDETSGINAVQAEGLKVNGAYYNLNGQRVAQPTKGLYIVNGKKVAIK